MFLAGVGGAGVAFGSRCKAGGSVSSTGQQGTSGQYARHLAVQEDVQCDTNRSIQQRVAGQGKAVLVAMGADSRTGQDRT